MEKEGYGVFLRLSEVRRKARFVELRSFFEMSRHSFPNHEYHKSSKGQLMSCKLRVKHDAGHYVES